MDDKKFFSGHVPFMFPSQSTAEAYILQISDTYKTSTPMPQYKYLDLTPCEQLERKHVLAVSKKANDAVLKKRIMSMYKNRSVDFT